LKVSIGPLRRLVHLQEVGGDRAALFLVVRKHGLNVADLLGIRELRTEGDPFNFCQRIVEALTHIVHEGVQSVALLCASGIVTFFVCPFTRVQRTMIDPIVKTTEG
jgi:hypothetical protein